MVTAGLSVQEIDIVETEGKVKMKIYLLSVKPNIMEEISNFDAKTEIEVTSGSPHEFATEKGCSVHQH